MKALVFAPGDCTEAELVEFETLVASGGAVETKGLAGRIRQAFRLLFMRDANGQLAGVGALKFPATSYREKVHQSAELPFSLDEKCLELGWLVVAPAFRGQLLSRSITRKLIQHSGKATVFATVRADASALQSILLKNGFQRAGCDFFNHNSDHKLVFYIRQDQPSAPRILIVSFDRKRTGIARLPRALQDAGFEVGIACFKDSHLAVTRFRDQFFPWNSKFYGGSLLRQLRKFIHIWTPDLLIPGDETTVLFLTQVFKKINQSLDPLAQLLKHSLGNPAALLEATSKRLTFEKARQLKIRAPQTAAVENEAALHSFIQQSGFPVMLKRSFSWGGNDSALCRNESETTAIWKKWYRKPGWKRRFYAWRNAIRGRELSRKWLPTDETIIASEYISGQTAMCMTVAFEGQLLAALTAVTERTFPRELSPSSVVRFVQNPEMRRIAEKMIATWKLSGFIGFDFILQPDGSTYLLECNPRPIPISHLGTQVGEDLCRALFNELTGQPAAKSNHARDLLVAHFPQEKLRDANSHFLTEAFHDVPEYDSALFHRFSKLGS